MSRPQPIAWARCAAEQLQFLAVGKAFRRWRAGAAASRAQVAPYAQSWEDATALAAEHDGPVRAVLGDSAAQGVGASAYDRGYVGQLRSMLDERDGLDCAVVNLSRSGARCADVVVQQLPRLHAVPGSLDLVTCAIGANDLLRTPMRRLQAQMREIIGGLPDGAVLATLPQGLAQRRARGVNALIRSEAPADGLVVADVWAQTGPPWRGKYADDFFHPNDTGYADWTRAFADALGL